MKKIGLIVFNAVMLFVFVLMDYFNFNNMMQFLKSSSAQPITFSYGIFGNTISIDSSLSSSTGLFPAMGMGAINLPFIAVLVLVIGNIIGLIKLESS
jgi:uncharacterized membrane protein YjfL (UPF0719 family)